MQKVHGPSIDTPAHARHGHLDQPAVSALVSLGLLLIICALIYFGFLGTR